MDRAPGQEQEHEQGDCVSHVSIGYNQEHEQDDGVFHVSMLPQVRTVAQALVGNKPRLVVVDREISRFINRDK